MILVGNCRGGGQELAHHLMSEENTHIEVHSIRGYMAEDLHGAFREAHALSKATKAKKYLYSLSLNPPIGAKVSTEEFEATIDRLERKLGLDDQPRAIVFHVKNGDDRRHAHVVWSRIDMDEMKAIKINYDRKILFREARELFLEHGWELPDGYRSPELADSRNFSLAEWQQAKRQNQDPRYLKQVFQHCWAISDGKTTLAHALREHGLILCQGERRPFVAVDRHGEVYNLARWSGVRVKQVRERLGANDDLPSIEEAKHEHAQSAKPTLDRWKNALDKKTATLKAVHRTQIGQIKATHQRQREELNETHQLRWQKEVKQRQERFNKGWRGLLDRFLTRRHTRIKNQNEREAYESYRRDRSEKDNLIYSQIDQLRDRKLKFEKQLKAIKTKHAQLNHLRHEMGLPEQQTRIRSQEYTRNSSLKRDPPTYEP
jgi:hypothetical protein